jgi:glycosyltransferase involved in cell wall biosynthesis
VLTSDWNSSAKRIIVHTSDYLGFDGEGTAGGRQRVVRDIASVIRDAWARDVLIVQKARKDFEAKCAAGFDVIGIKSRLDALGDAPFGYKTRTLLRTGDRMLYASGEDAWPFFAPNSKALQHGVWWDGPQSRVTRLVQKRRAIACLKAVDSILCVDTNFINWLRCQGAVGLGLASKCKYIPNYADIDKLGKSREIKSGPVRILCARRYEYKRGIALLIDALPYLEQAGLPFSLHVSAPGGSKQVLEQVERLQLTTKITVSEDNMNAVLSRYQDADIAVVPTIWSEGTSLACVEAICAGLPVVATPVGGLGNLIVPGFNGYLVEPTPKSIARGLSECMQPRRLLTMRENCLYMRDALSMQTWCANVLEWLKQ